MNIVCELLDTNIKPIIPCKIYDIKTGMYKNIKALIDTGSTSLIYTSGGNALCNLGFSSTNTFSEIQGIIPNETRQYPIYEVGLCIEDIGNDNKVYFKNAKVVEAELNALWNLIIPYHLFCKFKFTFDMTYSTFGKLVLDNVGSSVDEVKQVGGKVLDVFCTDDIPPILDSIDTVKQSSLNRLFDMR